MNVTLNRLFKQPKQINNATGLVADKETVLPARWLLELFFHSDYLLLFLLNGTFISVITVLSYVVQL